MFNLRVVCEWLALCYAGSNPVYTYSLVLGIVPAGMRFLAVQLQCVPADDDGELGLNSFASVLDIYVKMKDVHKHASQC